MSRRLFFAVCLAFGFAFNSALAQGGAGGAAQSAVLESVDEDIVEDEDVAVGKKTASASQKSEPQKESSTDELDIDKLLAGDDEEDLLAEEKLPVKEEVLATDTVKADSTAKSVEHAGEVMEDADENNQHYRGRGGRGRSARLAAADTVIDSSAFGPVIIEDGRSINFAHNLKEYRSPRLAMLMSLLVPGLGQAYSRSYTKAAAFGVVEIAAIGTAIYFNSAGNSKRREAHRFADDHFSVDNLKKYDSLVREKYAEVVKALPYDTAIYDKDFFIAAGNKETYYYERIREKYLTPGWIDFDPGIDEILKLIIDENSRFDDSWFGTSRFQATYNSMMKSSKSRFDAVNYTLYAILINHIVSAIDAGFTARAYNSYLLGKDDSVWNRFSVEQQYVFTGSEMTPGIALRVKF